jgi:hypothetical protein
MFIEPQNPRELRACLMALLDAERFDESFSREDIVQAIDEITLIAELGGEPSPCQKLIGQHLIMELMERL